MRCGPARSTSPGHRLHLDERRKTDDDSMQEEVHRELQRRGLAAANLPEGQPEHAAAQDPVPMAEAR
jgi:hypothetical protein